MYYNVNCQKRTCGKQKADKSTFLFVIPQISFCDNKKILQIRVNATKEIDKMLGLVLKQLRKERGILQNILAKDINVTQATISSWEIERTAPNIAQLNLLANYFNVTVDYLIGRTDECNAYIYDLGDNEKSFLKYYNKLNEREKRAFKAMLESYVKNK